MEAVSSQPKAPGVFFWVRSPEKCSIQPRSLFVQHELSNTPKYTSPSGPTAGEAVLESGSLASLPVSGSLSLTSASVARVVLSNSSK